MATIDLGKIKIVWRGTYAGGTAYTVDDAVEHTDSGITSSFICTTASTGNAPSTGGTVHGSWAYLAKGAAGSVLTTQGDILYRDGSGDQRLAKGTAAQTLKMNSGATAPEWTTVTTPTADIVKLASAEVTTGTSINIEDVFDDATYRGYKLYTYYHLDDDERLRFRLLNSSTAYTGASDYRRWASMTYRQLNNADSTITHWNDGDGVDYMDASGWSFSEKADVRWSTTFEFVGKYQASAHKPMFFNTVGLDTTSTNYGFNDSGAYYFYNTGSVDGVQMYTGGTNVNYLDYTLWGYKK